MVRARTSELLRCKLEECRPAAYVFAAALGNVKNGEALAVTYLESISSLFSDVPYQATEDGIVFRDGASITVMFDPEKTKLTILVLGQSAFVVLPEDDKNLLHFKLIGFRYVICLEDGNPAYYKQPIFA